MEHPVIAPHDGIVALDVAVGDQVRRDQVLAARRSHDAERPRAHRHPTDSDHEDTMDTTT